MTNQDPSTPAQPCSLAPQLLSRPFSVPASTQELALKLEIQRLRNALQGESKSRQWLWDFYICSLKSCEALQQQLTSAEAQLLALQGKVQKIGRTSLDHTIKTKPSPSPISSSFTAMSAAYDALSPEDQARILQSLLPDPQSSAL